jgi:Leucine-rich repeat (LRR) protein
MTTAIVRNQQKKGCNAYYIYHENRLELTFRIFKSAFFLLFYEYMTTVRTFFAVCLVAACCLSAFETLAQTPPKSGENASPKASKLLDSAALAALPMYKSFPKALEDKDHVFRLDLDIQKLTELPPKIAELYNLQELYANRNSLRSLPASIGKLTNLQVFYARRNRVSKMPNEIGNLVNLRAFDISDNELEVIPSLIGNLKNVRVLYLSRNYLTYIPPSIGWLRNLQELYLDNNQIEALPPEIGKLSSLVLLDLTGNNLTTLPLGVEQLVNLRELRLSGNLFSDVELQRIRELLPNVVFK